MYAFITGLAIGLGCGAAFRWANYLEVWGVLPAMAIGLLVALFLHLYCWFTDSDAEGVVALMVESPMNATSKLLGSVLVVFVPLVLPLGALLLMVGVIIQTLGGIWEQSVGAASSVGEGKGTERKPRAIRTLRLLYWFCGRENRETVEVISSDLMTDLAEMRAEKYNEYFVQLVLWWRVLAGAAWPIISDSLIRFFWKVIKLVGAAVAVWKIGK
ncbi:MAG TPA: hypothetical protein VG936_01395 [Lacunisphaera sp.]|nr:hypothetical protein [Lacunisphaera sp.]